MVIPRKYYFLQVLNLDEAFLRDKMYMNDKNGSNDEGNIKIKIPNPKCTFVTFQIDT